MSKNLLTKNFFFYTLLLLGGVAAFYLINNYGLAVFQTPATSPVTPVQSHKAINHLLHVLIALAAIIFIARIFGNIFQAIGQPEVIGEVVGGIFLGPSVLGQISPKLAAQILPAASAPFLSIIAQLGIILYM